MNDKTKPRPTDAELAILNVLWTHGPLTVRKVLDELSATREVGYTTVLKFLQIMTEKGLVTRDESQRSHIYHVVQQREEVQGNLVGDLISRAFGGSSPRLVMQALAAKKASPEDLAEIRAMLDKLEGDE